jgi:prepilin-type N-terminal cleavage/methylation domain-containing protein
MLKQLQKPKSESGSATPALAQRGFTIIEVLIVLAIAGLIMVVVFLAVPALQRSGRNNALNTDANNILAAVGNYSSNNGGTLPAALAATAPASGVVTIGAATTNQETAKVDSSVSTVQIDTGSTPITKSSSVGTIEVVTGTNGLCNSSNTALGTAGSGSPRSYAVLFVAESGSGNILKCIGAS